MLEKRRQRWLSKVKLELKPLSLPAKTTAKGIKSTAKGVPPSLLLFRVKWVFSVVKLVTLLCSDTDTREEEKGEQYNQS